MNQRQIKFRAWDIHTKTMLDSDFVGKNWSVNDLMPPSEFPIMQYTGFLDKNGKEIYEGDIVSYNETQTMKAHKQIVEWKSERANADCDCWGVEYSGFSLTSVKDCEIIGNIYENPELLNK